MSQRFTPLSTLAATPSDAGFQNLSVSPGFTTDAPHSATKPSTTTGEHHVPSPTHGNDSPLTASDEGGNSPCQASEPTLVLDRDGDRISRIRVLCACGQTVTIKCDYLEDPTPDAAEENFSQGNPTSPADSALSEGSPAARR